MPAGAASAGSGQDIAVRMTALRKAFGPLIAVDDLTLDIVRGEVFGMLGPNGSGKTTTIRMLCGLLDPTSGSASVAGFDVGQLPEDVKRHIGYMSQKYGLYDDLTVFENIRFYATIYGLRSDERAKRIDQLIDEELGLRERIDQRAGTLSGGWKQRLALACATAHRPPVLFLDEPTAGVDPASRRQFWARIHALAHGGTTILVTTHYMDEASQCARLAFLSRGRLIAVGSPAEIPAMFGEKTIEDVFVSLQEKDEDNLRADPRGTPAAGPQKAGR
jgi:drug efflux transport system ATP-binding protein